MIMMSLAGLLGSNHKLLDIMGYFETESKE